MFTHSTPGNALEFRTYWYDETDVKLDYIDVRGGLLPLPGDVNLDGAVNGLDVDPFVDVLVNSQFHLAADMNADGAVSGLDVAPFVAAVLGGGGAEVVPEPTTLMLSTIAQLGLLCWRRKGR
jgi:hypothetical protein